MNVHSLSQPTDLTPPDEDRPPLHALEDQLITVESLYRAVQVVNEAALDVVDAKSPHRTDLIGAQTLLIEYLDTEMSELRNRYDTLFRSLKKPVR